MKTTSAFICLIIIVLITIDSHGQLLTFDFDGLAGSELSANSNGNDPNVNSSTITRGSGLTASGNGDRFNATNWATGSINNAITGNNYMEFTLSPNSGCQFSITSVFIQLQRSGTGPSAIALRSSADGYTSNLDQIYAIVDNTSTQSFTFTFPLTSSTPVTFRIYMYAEAVTGSGGIGDGTGNDLIVNGTTSCGSSNTITTGAISTAPFTVNCSGTSASGSVDFTSTGTFTAGNTYSVELSDASGNFGSPIVIGAFNSTANAGNINFTLPAGTVGGSGYRIRVVGSDPVTTGTPSTSFTITQSGSCPGPHITSVMINSCSPSGCAEGNNEIIFGNTGTESITVTPADFSIFYGNSPGPGTNYTNSLTTNPTTTAALNAAAGCPGTFVEGTNANLPPNASFIVVRNTLCTDALDWSGLCGTGPIYVIYSTDSDWSTSGNFVNSASGLRYFQSNITGTGASYTYDYDWDSDDLALHSDGDFVNFPPTGGSATLYGNNGCTIDPIVLSAELILLKARYIRGLGAIEWSTASENNNDYFLLEHSSDGFEWTLIDRVTGHGTTQTIHTYSSVHYEPAGGINYYKLSTVDFDGKKEFRGIVPLTTPANFAYYDPLTSQLIFDSEGSYAIYSMDGRLVAETKNSNHLYLSGTGTFLVRDVDQNRITKMVLH